jgi:hypothetical protein
VGAGLGISKVEVRFDDGAWGPAQPSAQVNKNTWRMRRITRPLQTGNHKGLRPGRPIPDGSTGWHSTDFSVV